MFVRQLLPVVLKIDPRSKNNHGPRVCSYKDLYQSLSLALSFRFWVVSRRNLLDKGSFYEEVMCACSARLCNRSID